MKILCALVSACLMLHVGASSVTKVHAQGLRLSGRETLLFTLKPGIVGRSLLVSRDARRVAYVAGVSGGLTVILDGVPGGVYVRIAEGSLVFSEDGKRFAYGAERNGKNYVVVDGVEKSGYEGLGDRSIIFSPDGRRIAFTVRRDGKWLMNLDGVETEYDGIVGQSLRFSPDSQHFCFAAINWEGAAVVRDDVRGKVYRGIGVRSLAYSDDSKHLVYAAARGDKWVVAVDGVEGGEYSGVGEARLSADGQRLAYGADRGGKETYLVLDGAERGTYDSLGGFTFSLDGKHFALGAKRGRKWFVVADGVEVKSDEEADGILSGTPVLSLNGRHLAYIPNSFVTGKWRLILDGKKGQDYDGIGEASFSFSPNGEHFVYQADRGGKWYLVVDSAELGPYDGFLKVAQTHFIGPRSLVAVIVRGHQVFRNDIDLIEEK